MDEVDRRILRVLQEDADISSEQIAELVSLSASAVQRRISRLKRVGVIERIVAQLNARALGLPLTVIVEIEVQHERRDALERFERWLAAWESVQSCWRVTGSSDYMALVSVTGLDAYNEFTEALMTEQASVAKRFTSHVALKTVKQSTALPL